MSWDNFISEEIKKDYFKKIDNFLKEDSKKYTIFPRKENIFKAFEYCKFDNVKILLLGLDPYINDGQAHGLSFSVMPGYVHPPSLRNIFKELKNDLNIDNSMKDGYLVSWAEQGVLLLNTYLTVRKSETKSHSKIGWNIFSDNAIKSINEIDRPIVYMLFGADAKSKISLITNKKHLIIANVHPSPLSAHKGFFGSKPFSKANDFLIKNNIKPIDWQL